MVGVEAETSLDNVSREIAENLEELRLAGIQHMRIVQR